MMKVRESMKVWTIGAGKYRGLKIFWCFSIKRPFEI